MPACGWGWHHFDTFLVCIYLSYHIYYMYLDRQAWANSVDPDEMLQNAASHQGLHCLPFIQQCLDTTSIVNCTNFSNFRIVWGVQIFRVNIVLWQNWIGTNLTKICNHTCPNLFHQICCTTYWPTHCRLNELPHTAYWKILISNFGMSGYVL